MKPARNGARRLATAESKATDTDTINPASRPRSLATNGIVADRAAGDFRSITP